MRLIDADSVMSKVNHDIMIAKKESLEDVEWVLTFMALGIKNEPTVDAEPVKHGRWIGTGRTSVTCSECGEWTEVAGNYCPSCGAKMDGDGE